MTTVGVVTLNWNNFEMTRACVTSILNSTGVMAVPIVVDNGSADGSLERLRAEFANDVVFIANRRNEGFARASNIGLIEAIERGYDFLALLNNDALVEAGALEAATRTISRGTADLVSGLIYERREPDIVSYAGGRVSRVRGRAVVPQEHMPAGAKTQFGGRTRFVTGAFLVGGRETFCKTGLLPEDYFFGTEEWDFSMRALRRGLVLWVEPLAICVHVGAGSHPRTDVRWMYNSYRNKLIFQQRYLPSGFWPLWRLAFRVYSKTVMPRLRARLHAQKDATTALSFAAAAALDDHDSGRRVERFDLDRVAAAYAASRSGTARLGEP